MSLPPVVTAVAGVVTLALAAATVVVWSSEDGADTASDGREVVAPARELFMTKGCAACHDGPDSNSTFDVGPDLTELYLVAGSREPGLSPEDYVRRSISSPDSYVVAGFGQDGRGSMPALPLSEAEVEALTAYLLAST